MFYVIHAKALDGSLFTGFKIEVVDEDSSGFVKKQNEDLTAKFYGITFHQDSFTTEKEVAAFINALVFPS